MTLTCGVCMLLQGIHAREDVRSATTVVHGTAVCNEQFADLVAPGLSDELKRLLEAAA